MGTVPDRTAAQAGAEVEDLAEGAAVVVVVVHAVAGAIAVRGAAVVGTVIANNSN